jgi:protein SCO1/2
MSAENDPTPPLRWFLWALLVAVLLALAVAGLIGQRIGAAHDDAPVPLGALPEFRFTDRNGQQLSLADLRGGPWVASFIFTRCGGTCPLVVHQMDALARALPHPERVQRVSFSVDPEWDTPEILERYAVQSGIGPVSVSHWHFLSGPGEVMREFIRKGFMLAVEPGAGSVREPVLHSTRLVLVDGQARIRSYYDTDDPAALTRLVADIEALLQGE